MAPASVIDFVAPAIAHSDDMLAPQFRGPYHSIHCLLLDKAGTLYAILTAVLDGAGRTSRTRVAASVLSPLSSHHVAGVGDGSTRLVSSRPRNSLFRRLTACCSAALPLARLATWELGGTRRIRPVGARFFVPFLQLEPVCKWAPLLIIRVAFIKGVVGDADMAQEMVESPASGTGPQHRIQKVLQQVSTSDAADLGLSVPSIAQRLRPFIQVALHAEGRAGYCC